MTECSRHYVQAAYNETLPFMTCFVCCFYGVWATIRHTYGSQLLCSSHLNLKGRLSNSGTMLILRRYQLNYEWDESTISPSGLIFDAKARLIELGRHRAQFIALQIRRLMPTGCPQPERCQHDHTESLFPATFCVSVFRICSKMGGRQRLPTETLRQLQYTSSDIYTTVSYINRPNQNPEWNPCHHGDPMLLLCLAPPVGCAGEEQGGMWHWSFAPEERKS